MIMNADPTPHLIGADWMAADGPSFTSRNPADGSPVWRGDAASDETVDAAVQAARTAFPEWSTTPLQDRIALLEAFAERLDAGSEEFAARISEEMGKPRWESLTEIGAMRAKVGFSIEAHRERRHEIAAESGEDIRATRYKPHGVAAVLGPFNLPGHLPNAHIVPALLAGNTVVFKPSEQVPGSGRLLARTWREAGLPDGVLNLVQGERATGSSLVQHPDLNAIYFTGGLESGRAISRSRADSPNVLLALEMGGNNPLVVWDPCEIRGAVYQTVLSSFLTAGQRCSSARRLILPRGSFGDQFLETLVRTASQLRVGPADTEPEPFLGPVISPAAADRVVQARDDLVANGATELLALERRTEALLSPGILDVSAVRSRPDEEIFGPLLQVIRVDTFEDAVAEANATAFGLSAGLLCQDRARWEWFFREARAGIVNWNQPITGASGAQPFGGIGLSGNHRPSGYFAADYCSYPVASTESAQVTLPSALVPGVELD